MICPNCGISNPGGRSTCGACGQPLSGGVISCPACGQVNPGSRSSCGACGFSFFAAPPPPPAAPVPYASSPTPLPAPVPTTSSKGVAGAVAGGVVGFLMLLVIGGIIIANLGSDNTASNTGNKNAGNTPANVSRTINFPASTNSDKILTRTFKWSYRGRSYAFTVNIPDAQYQAARAAVRPVIKTSTGATIQPVRDAGIDLVAKGLYEEANKASYDHMKTLEFVATFVQKLPYTSDKATTGYDEYPRYPVETLVDNGGDCEDTALLAAVLLKSMGYDTVLVNPPGHMAVAVLGGFDFYGTFFSYQGGKYYYLETTGEGWPVGDLPPEYKNTKVLIYTLK